MPQNNDYESKAKAFEELRNMQERQEKKSAEQKTMDRRYVGAKESVGFIIWDAAQSFNINIFLGDIIMYDKACQLCTKEEYGMHVREALLLSQHSY